MVIITHVFIQKVANMCRRVKWGSFQPLPHQQLPVGLALNNFNYLRSNF